MKKFFLQIGQILGNFHRTVNVRPVNLPSFGKHEQIDS